MTRLFLPLVFFDWHAFQDMAARVETWPCGGPMAAIPSG